MERVVLYKKNKKQTNTQLIKDLKLFKVQMAIYQRTWWPDEEQKGVECSAFSLALPSTEMTTQIKNNHQFMSYRVEDI